MKIRAFKNASSLQEPDRELFLLAQYLDRIGDMDDLSSLRHSVSSRSTHIITNIHSQLLLIQTIHLEMEEVHGMEEIILPISFGITTITRI